MKLIIKSKINKLNIIYHYQKCIVGQQIEIGIPPNIKGIYQLLLMFLPKLTLIISIYKLISPIVPCNSQPLIPKCSPHSRINTLKSSTQTLRTFQKILVFIALILSHKGYPFKSKLAI